jgi:hypothetical protein
MTTLAQIFNQEQFMIDRAKRAIYENPHVFPGCADWNKYVLTFNRDEIRFKVQHEDTSMPKGWEYVQLSDLSDYTS